MLRKLIIRQRKLAEYLLILAGTAIMAVSLHKLQKVKIHFLLNLLFLLYSNYCSGTAFLVRENHSVLVLLQV